MGYDNVCLLSLFVYVILIGGFDEGKVLFQDAFQIASSFLYVTYQASGKAYIRVYSQQRHLKHAFVNVDLA